MGKRIPGRLRQRRVAVAYGVVWGLLVVAIAFFSWNTLRIISVQIDEKDVWSVWKIYCLPLLFLVGFIVVSQIIYWRRKVWQQSRPILTMRLILIFVFVLFFQCVLAVPNGIGLGFYLGKGDPEPGLVSIQEVIFIWVLFLVGALFQCILIKFENRQAEVDKVVGGILIIMGIMMPKLLESWTLLSVHCGIGNCTPDQFEVFVLFKMGIAYAVGLSVMFVVGLFSETIIGFFRSSEEKQTLASPCGSGDAVSKQLMSAAVSGLVAGVCFSVASRLFGRR